VMNIGLQVSPLYPDLCSLGYMPKSVIMGSYGRSIFHFLRNLNITFQNGCTNLHSQQQCIRVPVSPHPHQYLLLLLPLNMVIVTGVRWNLTVVLICKMIAFLMMVVLEDFWAYLRWSNAPWTHIQILKKYPQGWCEAENKAQTQ
jgi:hypothetical protein